MRVAVVAVQTTLTAVQEREAREEAELVRLRAMPLLVQQILVLVAEERDRHRVAQRQAMADRADRA